MQVLRLRASHSAQDDNFERLRVPVAMTTQKKHEKHEEFD